MEAKKRSKSGDPPVKISTRRSAAAIEAGRKKPEPRTLSIATRGIRTGADFSDMMSALMSDLIEGRISPEVGNATCNAGGKLLKAVELQMKYGTPVRDTGGRKTLVLAGGLEKAG